MKKLLLLVIAAIAASSLMCCKKKIQETEPQRPMFWTWLDYRPTMNFDSMCAVMDLSLIHI